MTPIEAVSFGPLFALKVEAMGVLVDRISAPRLPHSQTRAVWTLALFVAIQLADGMMTAVGVARFGLSIEANPLVLFLATMLGAAGAIAAAKILALVSGLIVYGHGRYLVLSILALGYVFAAIVPWAWLLNT